MFFALIHASFLALNGTCRFLEIALRFCPLSATTWYRLRLRNHLRFSVRREKIHSPTGVLDSEIVVHNQTWITLELAGTEIWKSRDNKYDEYV